jgi:exonuclease III
VQVTAKYRARIFTSTIRAGPTAPGDPADTHSRDIEATVNGGLVACLYMPNGNPVAARRPAWVGLKRD